MNKVINDNYIIAVSTGKVGEQISDKEYNEILSAIQSRPTPPKGYDYKLRADSLAWELVELPPIDDTDDDATEADYIEALNDVGVDMGMV